MKKKQVNKKRPFCGDCGIGFAIGRNENEEMVTLYEYSFGEYKCYTCAKRYAKKVDRIKKEEYLDVDSVISLKEMMNRGKDEISGTKNENKTI